MSSFITEAALFHFVSEAYNSGVSRDELMKLVDPTLFNRKPNLATKIYIDKIHPILRLLHDVGYQKNRELVTASNLYHENDLHNAYFSNAPDLYSFIMLYLDMCQRQTSSMAFEINTAGVYTTVFIDFIDNKSEFYSPQCFHVMLIMLAKRIFKLTDSQLKGIVSGFTQCRIPDEDGFSKLATEQFKFKEARGYIIFPSATLEIKNPCFNPFLACYLTSQFNQYYGIPDKEDKLLADITAHLSALWAQGDGVASIDVISEKIGMSRSKLYRNLAQRNITFSSIVESQRKNYAMLHIKDKSISIAEISDHLGYANVSAFTRAFNRWFNVTPSKMR